MAEWLRREPIVITEAKGAVLRDIRGRAYLDANSSIWTNLHGHGHPKLNAAIRRQLAKISHSSALGLANEPASLLAEKLIGVANRVRPWLEREPAGGPVERSGLNLTPGGGPAKGRMPNPRLAKVFYSDDGSTAMEVAVKLAYEFSRRTGRTARPRFLSLGGAYHGDTLGAVALGHIGLFHQRFSALLFKTDEVMAPYCYRCPFNRAKPERTDARACRKCQWECLDQLEGAFRRQRTRSNPYAAFVFEPLLQGAGGMIAQPEGWLARAAAIARENGALLIADEVMTGFGRTGGHLFACHREGVQPDFLALAKGLTGGYLPMAATLTTQAVFDAFLGRYEEFKTFFHGHSFTANQLGAAAAMASLDLLATPASVQARARIEAQLRSELERLWRLPTVGDIRQVGLVAGIELVKDWRTRKPFDLRERAGIRVCEAMARRGVLTRPIGNVVVLMPPYCTTPTQLHRMVDALEGAIAELE